MKKLSIIILVVALAGSMAFGADIAISGDATFSTSFDLQTMSGGFDLNANTLAYTASIVLITGGSTAKTGEGDVYAVLEVSVANWEIAVDQATAPALPVLGAITIDTFKIVAGDVTVNLLGNTPAGNFAQYFDYSDGAGGDPDDVADIDVASLVLAGKNGGVDVTAGDITVGADFWQDGTVTPAVTTYMVWGAYSADLAEGMTVSLAAGIDDAAGADVAGQLAYAADGYGVTVGFDSADNFALYEVEADIDAVIDIVTIDANVYYDSTSTLVRVADQNTVALDGVTIGLDFYWDDLNSGKKVAADVATTMDALTASLAGGYKLDGTNDIDALLTLGYVVSDATIIDARVGYNSTSTGLVNVGATLTQTMDAGTVVAAVDYQNDATIDVAINFTSTTLVDGATLAIGWNAADVAADLGDIVASVTVSL